MLKSIFELQDRFSSRIERIIRSSDKAAKSIGQASLAADKAQASYEKMGGGAGEAATKTDKVTQAANKAEKQLKKTKSAADKVGDALKKAFAISAIAAGAQKLASVSDNYSNANARLALINTDSDGNVKDPQLQNKVYASAQRSRASYGSTANAVASFALNAGKAFGNTDEAIAFTEAINKQMVIAGASAETAEGAITQLTQAMGSGTLRGEELNSVLDAASGIARNIEKYMGWAEGSIKSYAEKGAVSAEIVKNSQLAALDEINKQYNSMPYTWSQIMTKVSNSMLRASQPLLTVVSWIANNMDIIGPLLLGIAGAVGVYMVATYGAAAAQWVLNAAAAAWSAIMTMNPIGLAVMGVVLLVAALYAGVAAFNKFSGASVSATGIIVAAFYVLAAYAYNTLIFPIQNGFAMLANFIGNVFHDPVAAVKVLFYDMAITCLDYVINMARAIESVINKIPGATADITSGLENVRSGLENKANKIKDESGWKEYVKQPKMIDYVEAAGKGYEKGSSIGNNVKDFFGGGADSLLGGLDSAMDGIGTTGNPAAVEGTGKNGSMNVSLEDEDIDYLRQLAERDYVARISQNTLAPHIQVEFTGPINQTTDVDAVAGRITQLLRDEIEAQPEG